MCTSMCAPAVKAGSGRRCGTRSSRLTMPWATTRFWVICRSRRVMGRARARRPAGSLGNRDRDLDARGGRAGGGRLLLLLVEHLLDDAAQLHARGIGDDVHQVRFAALVDARLLAFAEDLVFHEGLGDVLVQQLGGLWIVLLVAVGRREEVEAG